MKGKPIAEVCRNFFAHENGTRYRARLELSGRETSDVVAELGAFAATLNPANDNPEKDEAQALLECLWVFEEHRVPNLELLKRVVTAKEPRVRAAAIRTLGHWAGRVTDWEKTLMSAARDESALVRAEAVKSAVDLGGLTGAEAVFAANTMALDPEMETVLKYAKSQLDIDSMIKQMLATGKELSPAANAYVLATGTANDLVRLEPNENVYRAILSRTDASLDQLQNAVDGLAAKTGVPSSKLIVDLIEDEQTRKGGNIVGLGQLLAAQPIEMLKAIQAEVENLAVNGATPDVKRLGYAAWVAASGPGDAFLAATKSKDRLRDFLDAVPTVNAAARGALFDKVKPLIFELPASFESESVSGAMKNGVTAAYLFPNGADATNQTLDTRQPAFSNDVAKFEISIPPGQSRDGFTNIFKAFIEIPKTGNYTFFTTSDDGSRLYIDDQEVVNNDGPHGMVTQSGNIQLNAGMHPIRVNYFDSGGGDGLIVGWKGPGFEQEEIPAGRLYVGGGETLHEVAIRALTSIPGRDAEKFNALCTLVAAGKYQPAAIAALKSISDTHWNTTEIKPLVNNIVAYLSTLPASRRTSESAVDAINFARALSRKLPKPDQNDIEGQLMNLDVRVIAIGTVPHRMIYDKEMIVVEAGKPVEFRFSNTDSMPHNFAVTVPGALAEVGELAEATGRDADAIARHYIPKSNKILVSSKLLQPGDEEAISFEAPTQPGVYPYVCTYPGHWRRMHGALYVVPSFGEFISAPSEYLAALDLPIEDELLRLNTRGQQWTYDDLIDDLNMIMGRSHEVGKASFKAANCVACHQFGGEGQNFGPDLSQLTDEKRTAAHVLRSIIEPSKDIDDKFASNIFVLDTGATISGMIMEENDDVVKIVIDPLAKDQLTVIKKDEIDGRKKSNLSQMPEGMLDKLSREEIIDLIAYVLSNANPKHKMFEGGHGHNP